MRTIKKIIAVVVLVSFSTFSSFSCGTITTNIKETRVVHGFQQKVDDSGNIVESKDVGIVGQEEVERIEEKPREVPWWVWVLVGLGVAGAAAAGAAAAAAGGGGASASATIAIPK